MIVEVDQFGLCHVSCTKTQGFILLYQLYLHVIVLGNPNRCKTYDDSL